MIADAIYGESTALRLALRPRQRSHDRWPQLTDRRPESDILADKLISDLLGITTLLEHEILCMTADLKTAGNAAG